MTDKKPTDVEIGKALMICGSTDSKINCKNCPLKLYSEACITILMKYALDLINRLQTENKRLSTLAELGNKRADDYRVMRDRALKAEKEVERLAANEAEISKRLDVVLPQLKEIDNRINTIKAEAYKEFAERLKRRFLNKNEVINNTIDNLLKELVGGDK